MAAAARIVISSLLVYGYLSQTEGHRMSDEEMLLHDLFQDYNPSARPVINSSQTVTVSIQFSLLQIQELNVRSQVLTATGLLILRWTDERLRWDKSENEIDELVLEGKNIWKPEFAVINGAEGIYEDFSQFQATVRPDGSIRWEPGGVFKTMCQIDITYYPFDEQRCDLIFGAWSYYTSKMNLTTMDAAINLDTYETNGEWEIHSTSVKRNEFNFECCPNERFSNVAFSVFLKRRHTFYVMNVILPSIMTSALLLSIFFCVPAQKVHIGVASLLSFQIFLLNVADNIPRTSDHIPLLGIYLTCTMAITTLAMVATVFVLNLYFNCDKPVPRWAKIIVIKYVSRLLCMSCCCNVSESHTILERVRLDHPSRSIDRHHDRNKNKYGAILKHTPEDAEECIPMTSLPERSGYETETSGDPELESDIELETKELENNHISPVPCELRPVTGIQASAAAKVDHSKEWRKVAEVFDRFFFALTLIAIIATTLLLFHPITNLRAHKINIQDAKGVSR